MKKLLSGMILAISPSLFASEQTIAIAPQTELLSVNVLFGFKTGCSPITVDLDAKYSHEGQKWIIEKKPDPTQEIFQKLQENLSLEAMTEVFQTLSQNYDGLSGGVSICQAEMPVFGQVYIEVNGKHTSEVTLKVQKTGVEHYGKPEITSIQFKSI